MKSQHTQRFGFVLISLLACLVSAAPAGAATGDKIAEFTAADPQNCFSIQGVNTGIAFDGTNLLLTCWGSNVIDVVKSTDGTLVTQSTIAAASDFGAAAWDAKRNRLWVCNSDNQVWLVNPADGTGSKQFDSKGCVDGLAYDGTDDTIWSSRDATCDGPQHYTVAGVLIDEFDVCNPVALLGGSGNSGIAVGGAELYLGNNGGSQVWRVPKTVDSSTLFFDNVDDSGEARRVEDLECDNVTFAGSGRQAMWVQDAYDRIVKAVEIPPNQCGFGGLPPQAPAAATPTPTPAPAPVQPAAVKPAAKASLRSGQKGCTRTTASARVSGQNISSVRYSLDGEKIATKKGNKTSVKVSAKRLKSGAHTISARIAFTGATGAKAQTKRVTFQRCARAVIKPKFTG